MAGTRSRRRERLTARLFACALQHADGRRARFVEMREKAGRRARGLEVAGRRVGVELTELLEPADGRDRALEAEARRGIVAACREVLGPSGRVDVLVQARPRGRRQVERWLAAFRAWLVANREQLRAGSRPQFPSGLAVRLARIGRLFSAPPMPTSSSVPGSSRSCA